MRQAASVSPSHRWCRRDRPPRNTGVGADRLSRQPEFSRTAVIINEFGEIGLDHDLVEASEDSLIELTTGCLCCKVRTDLAETLQDLLRRRDQGGCAAFDRIVIETSGLADPAPILQTLMTDASLAERLVVGSVATTF